MVIDTFNNVNEPAVPFLAVVQNAAIPVTLVRGAIPNVRDAANHRLRVRLDAGNVSVWLDAINYDGSRVQLTCSLPHALGRYCRPAGCASSR